MHLNSKTLNLRYWTSTANFRICTSISEVLNTTAWNETPEHNLKRFSAGVCFLNRAQVRNTVLHQCSSGPSERLQMCTLVPSDSLCWVQKEGPLARKWHAGSPSDQAGSRFPQGPLMWQWCLLHLSPLQHQLSSPEWTCHHHLWPTQDIKEGKKIS